MTAEATPRSGTTLVATDADGGRRLDEFLATALAVGRRAAMRLATRAHVNGRTARKGDRLHAGDRIEVPDADIRSGAAADAGLVVRRELRTVLVLDKPAGLPSVALKGAGGDSLAARIARRFPECASLGTAGEAGLVHRLDTGTSGLLLAARTAEAHAALRAQFRAHAVVKEYRALVAGRLDRALRIDAPIGQHRSAVRRVRAIESADRARRYASREASTEVTPERVFATATLVRARTTTGARHQIRVHLASIGHPLVGDPLYGSAEPGSEGFLLHAEHLEWTDPETGRAMHDEAPLPATWDARLAELTRTTDDPQPTADEPSGAGRARR